jgi:hypothetical protein
MSDFAKGAKLVNGRYTLLDSAEGWGFDGGWAEAHAVRDEEAAAAEEATWDAWYNTGYDHGISGQTQMTADCFMFSAELDAYNAGYSDGEASREWEAGAPVSTDYIEGWNEGYRVGHAEGYVAGEKDGLFQGYVDGYEMGREDATRTYDTPF